MAEHLVRVRFELDPCDWHGHASKSLWAAPVPQTEWRNFRIMNSPFFARGISHLDVVRALPVERNAVFDFEDVIERGGHSTYMLIVPIFEARERVLEHAGKIMFIRKREDQSAHGIQSSAFSRCATVRKYPRRV